MPRNSKSINSFPNNIDEFFGAEDVMRWLHGRTSGVFGDDNNCIVSVVPGSMSVSVSDGTGWINNADGDGVVWWNDYEKRNSTPRTLIIAPADSTLNRIDRIIVTWNPIDNVELPEIQVVTGVLAETPTPPDLTNDSTTRQLSLAIVRVDKGTIELTPTMIDNTYRELVTETVNIDTSAIYERLRFVNDQSTAVLDAINAELAELEADTAVELKKLLFLDTLVPATVFVSNNTYQDYPYRAAVALADVLSSMVPDVTLSVEDATSGNFAPVAECYNGGVYLYAAAPPDGAVTIPTIICWRGGVV